MKIVYQILPWVIIVIVLFFWRGTCNSKQDLIQLNNVAADSLHISYNKLGQQTASIEVFQSDKKKDFLDIKTRDSIIISLQQLVKKTKNIQEAIVVSNNTSNHINGQTIITKRDTVRKDSVIYIYPEYSFNRKTEWDSVSVKSNKDST